MSSLWRLSDRQGRWWTFLTVVIVLLVIFVADVDNINSYASFIGLFLHIIPSGVVM